MVIPQDPDYVTKDHSKVDVLDHGYVRLANDMSIVRSARVSFDAEPRGDGSDEKLINYLMKNNDGLQYFLGNIPALFLFGMGFLLILEKEYAWATAFLVVGLIGTTSGGRT